MSISFDLIRTAFDGLVSVHVAAPATLPTAPPPIALDQPIWVYLAQMGFWALLAMPGLAGLWWYRTGRRHRPTHLVAAQVATTPPVLEYARPSTPDTDWSSPRAEKPAAALWLGAGVMIWAFLFVPPLARSAFASSGDGTISDSAMIGILTITYLVGLSIVAALHVVMSQAGTARGVDALGLRGIGRAVLPAIIAIGIVVPITNIVTAATTLAWKVFRVEHESAHALLQLMGRNETIPWVLIGTIFNAAILAPVFEELLFRGHLQTALTTLFRSRWPAILISSTLFTITHASWTWPPIFVLSVGIGYAYERTGSFWVPLAIHVAFNSISTTLFLIAYG